MAMPERTRTLTDATQLQQLKDGIIPSKTILIRVRDLRVRRQGVNGSLEDHMQPYCVLRLADEHHRTATFPPEGLRVYARRTNVDDRHYSGSTPGFVRSVSKSFTCTVAGRKHTILLELHATFSSSCPRSRAMLMLHENYQLLNKSCGHLFGGQQEITSNCLNMRLACNCSAKGVGRGQPGRSVEDPPLLGANTSQQLTVSARTGQQW